MIRILDPDESKEILSSQSAQDFEDIIFYKGEEDGNDSIYPDSTDLDDTRTIY